LSPPRSWNFRESRGDGKIRGRWKIQQPPPPPPPPPSEHPWPTPHSENAWEALPGAPFIAGLAEGRRRARRAEEGDVGGGWGAGNLIANTFHGPANFKPISSVYCQSQRARNSSLSARNEILPVVPFRRSPCPFDLHWRRLGNLRDTRLSRYLNERAPPRFTRTEADSPFRRDLRISKPMRSASDRIGSGQPSRGRSRSSIVTRGSNPGSGSAPVCRLSIGLIRFAIALIIQRVASIG